MNSSGGSDNLDLLGLPGIRSIGRATDDGHTTVEADDAADHLEVLERMAAVRRVGRLDG